MPLEQYLINDIKPLDYSAKVSDLKMMFNELTYSHIPITKEGIYMGCISETDAHCFEGKQAIEECSHSLEGFYVRDTSNWLDALEAFAQNSCNIMPVLNAQNQYLGYYELNDIIGIFNETPFFAEPGGVLIVETTTQDYSFSEISQIVESNDAKLLGAFISKMESDIIQITLKIGEIGLNDVIQTFRRYSYNIISGHEDDTYVENLKERSEYLKKYLDV